MPLRTTNDAPIEERAAFDRLTVRYEVPKERETFEMSRTTHHEAKGSFFTVYADEPSNGVGEYLAEGRACMREGAVTVQTSAEGIS